MNNGKNIFKARFWLYATELFILSLIKKYVMKEAWFKKWGWLYLPTHVMGVIITLLAIAFMVPVVIAANRSAHSVTDELYEIFVFATCTAFWWKWVAEKTSE